MGEPSHEATSSPRIAPMAGEARTPDPPSRSGRRWLVIAAWSTGLAALYALLGLVHAAAQGVLDVDVGFGRSLAFWVGAVYLTLGLWGFLPPRPLAWYSRRGPVIAAGLLGAVGTLVCGGFTVAWLASHWTAAVGTPVILSLAALAGMIALTMWVAGREDQ